jgi:predicted small lipoprotein YifL
LQKIPLLFPDVDVTEDMEQDVTEDMDADDQDLDE